MGKMSKRLTGLITTLVLTTGLFCGTGLFKTPVKAYAASGGRRLSYDLAGSTKDGVILHAWNWSFNTIKQNLPQIAEAGYTSVQTSPIQGTKENSMGTGQWWLLYQPTNFRIGNAQLGSRDEFRSMCEEAEKYGIKIIVDVVCNHMANTGGNQYKFSTAIEDKYEAREFWHNYDNPHGIDYGSRYSITHDCMELPDLNTGNKTLQNDIVAFLNDAIDCGADGFRFDAAKHIELPDDPGGSDFWPTILGNLKNKEQLFIYGEILDTNGGNSRTSAYSNYINVNSEAYSQNLRAGIGYNGSDTAKNIGQASSGNYNTNNVDSKKLVTYVETHDDYAGMSKHTTNMSDWYNKMGWAIVASRASGTPLYFNRPANSSASNPLPGSMGNAGNNMWKDADVVAVNKFHNAMIGEKEYIRTLSNTTMVIERGNKGAVIVNLDGTANINTETNLQDGEYTNIASTGGTFKVSNGRLTGTLKSGQIAVFYKNSGSKTEAKVSSSKENCNFTNTLSLTLSASNCDSATYSINGGREIGYTDGTSITIGKDASVGDKITVTLKAYAGETKVEKTYVYTKVDAVNQKVVYFKKPSGWGAPKVYIYDDTNSSNVKYVAGWPGVAMTSEGGNLYSYTLPEEWNDLNAKVIFTDGNNQIPNRNKPGLNLTSNSMIYDNGSWYKYNGGSSEDEALVAYFVKPSNWGTPKVYVYDDRNGSVKKLYNWPGEVMTSEGGNVYSYKLPKEWKYAKVIFSDGFNQIPNRNKQGLEMTSSMIYDNGSWYKYNGGSSEDEKDEALVAYFVKPSNWGTPKAYVYDDRNGSVKKLSDWPGEVMTSEGGNIYSYKLPKEWKYAKVIFSDGFNQIPGQNRPGLEMTTSMIYDNGSWYQYNK